MRISEAVRRMGGAETHRDRRWDRAVRVTDTAIRTAEPGWLAELLEALLAVPAPTHPQRFGYTAALKRLAAEPGGADRIALVRRFTAAGRAWVDEREMVAPTAGGRSGAAGSRGLGRRGAALPVGRRR